MLFKDVQKLYGQFYTIFTVHATNFGKFVHRGNISVHAGYSKKIQYLTLDLLKKFFLWTFGNKTTKNESLNLRL